MASRKLQKKLGVALEDTALLERALTHRSADNRNNERLEYLGDAVLGMVVAEALFKRYPDADEGDLSRYRARLVKGESLAELARELDLGAYLKLGSGELKSGGFRRSSILADALESVIGAIYLDQGIEVARSMVLALLGDRLDRVSAGGDIKDPKTRLQEYLQGQQRDLPEYEVVKVTGQPHEQEFLVECRVTDVGLVEQATGSSRRRAEQSAARRVLSQLLDE